MKLLLREDIRNLGMCGDVVEVKQGYARNYLIPQNLAMAPTQANMNAISDAREKAAERRRLLAEEMKAAAKRLNDLEVTIRAAVNEDGHLYGSVGPREISAALRSEGHSVEAEQVLLNEPIRNLDNIMVPIRFSDDVQAEVKVWVVRETAGKEDDEDIDGKAIDTDTEDSDRGDSGTAEYGD